MFYHFVFGFKQELLIKLKVSLEQSMLLDFLYKFFDEVGSPYSICRDGEKYFWVSYSFIVKNLPLIASSVKKVQKMVDDLQQKNILTKIVRANRMYIHINTNKLLFEPDGDT